MKITEGIGKPGEQVLVTTDRQNITVSYVEQTGDYVVSEDQAWLPGAFDSRTAALMFVTMLTPEQQETLSKLCLDGKTVLGVEEIAIFVEERLSP